MIDTKYSFQINTDCAANDNYFEYEILWVFYVSASADNKYTRTTLESKQNPRQNTKHKQFLNKECASQQSKRSAAVVRLCLCFIFI